MIQPGSTGIVHIFDTAVSVFDQIQSLFVNGMNETAADQPVDLFTYADRDFAALFGKTEQTLHCVLRCLRILLYLNALHDERGIIVMHVGKFGRIIHTVKKQGRGHAA